MKNLLYTIIILFGFNIYSQKKEFLLSELDIRLLNEINGQGFRNFKKSQFYNRKFLDLNIYPNFLVTVKGNFNNIDFRIDQSILSNLFFERESKKKLFKDVSWNILNLKDSLVYPSDSNKYYRYYLYDGEIFFGDSYKKLIQKIDLKTIRFSFIIYNFPVTIVFYVTNSNKILVRDESIEKWMTLEEFDKELKEKKYVYEKL